MTTESTTEAISCPCCDGSSSQPWSEENGFKAVKCDDCGLVYVNPRPVSELIDEAVKTGVHSNVDHTRTAVARRSGSGVQRYQKILGSMFADVWQRRKPITWLDIGAGYGEVLEALVALSPANSRIEGLEPMEPKRVAARARGPAASHNILDSGRCSCNVLKVQGIFEPPHPLARTGR